MAAIREIFDANAGVYGAPRIRVELRENGWRVSKKRVARLMAANGMSARRKKKRPPKTTDSNHGGPIAPNLLERNFAATEPDKIWLGDIAYIPTDEGWLYLAAIKDMATREIVSRAMDDNMEASLCRRALLMAIQRRSPGPGLIVLGPRIAVRERALSNDPPPPQNPRIHEPEGRLSG